MTKTRILIVEDDLDLARALSLRLKASGFLPLRVSDTIQALRLIRLDPPDLLILDLGLPGGDGFLLMERLSFLPVDVPVIVVTARDAMENRDKAFTLGASAYFQKPVDNSELLLTIRASMTRERVGKEIDSPPRSSDDGVPKLHIDFDTSFSSCALLLARNDH